MLTVETVLKIRLAAKRDGQSKRGIAKKYPLSRNTVRKYLRTDEVEPRYRRRQEVRPRLGPFLGELEQLLAEEAKRPKQERRTALMLFEELHRRGCRWASGG
jgi:predicted transcriptional regulator